MNREPLTCGLCERTDWSVHPRLVEWKPSAEHPPGMLYEWLDRCTDDAACRVRVEGSGAAWPVREAAA